MPQRFIARGSLLLALVSFSLWAAEKHDSHTPGMHQDGLSAGGTVPDEGGQSTFAALIEIVALLEADPHTDWGAVDIDALRSHLLDMDRLALETEATKTVIDDTQIRFDVLGTINSIPSIHRMVPVHSHFIQQSRGWIVAPALNSAGATITITVDDNATLILLNALGFYGFMSLDSHHQAHHYQIARGEGH